LAWPEVVGVRGGASGGLGGRRGCRGGGAVVGAVVVWADEREEHMIVTAIATITPSAVAAVPGLIRSQG